MSFSALGVLAVEYSGIYIAIAVVLGLMIGSFLNVVIYRLPIMMQRTWRRDCCELLETAPPQEASEKFNLAFPDSRCPGCNSPIRPWQNIPIVSYLFLRGRCSNCQQTISPRYPAIELLTGVLTGFIAWQFGYGLTALALMVLTWSLIALTFIDIDHQLLPDSITLPLLWLGLLLNTQYTFTDLPSAVFGAAAGYLILWSVYWSFKLLTGKEGMGYGDFKLLAALGAWLGWQALPLIIILSSCVGAIIGIAGILILGRNRNIPIPFGPYLAIAGWITVMWGDTITGAYLHFAGFETP